MANDAIAQGKASPPDLTLRAAPAPVTRFNRRILTVLVGIAALAVFGALFYSLGLRHGAKPGAQELYAANQPVTDRLNALPSTYGDVPQPKPASEPPQLGPPLPAALPQPAPPIQQPGSGSSQPSAPDPADRDADQARVSKVFFGMSGTAGFAGAGALAGPATSAADPVVLNTTPAAVSPLGADSAQNEQDRKQAFLQARPGESVVSAERLRAPASPYLVTAGSAIRAALVTAVNSDLPGLAEAQVTENVCDSVTGRSLLIPQGAKLIGEVDSQVSYGQERLLAAWTQLKFPDGSTLVLDRLPGSDAAGAAGFDADVDYHTWRLAKGVILSSLLGISTELAANSGTDNNNRIIVATRDSTNDSINQVGQRITQKELAVQPTLTRAAGYPFAIVVAKDLVLRPRGPC
jgi:type IV secretion system protein TrbI